MTVADQHSTGASLAGFGLQLDRAIEWLSRADLGDRVGIESLDDVVMIDSSGTLHLEQDKLSFRRNPITDHSVNLWKTLFIWTSMVENGECSLDSCKFFLVTNQPVRSGIAAILRLPPSQRDRIALCSKVRTIAGQPANAWAEYAIPILRLSDHTLQELLDRIQVVDEAPFADLDGANSHLGSILSLPGAIYDPVINGLRGWIIEIAIRHFANCALNRESVSSDPAWIDVTIFRDVLARLIQRHHENKMILRAAKEITVTSEQQEGAKQQNFVKQLEIINFDTLDPEAFLESIIDFYRSQEERTRLAEENAITGKAFETYESQLLDRWKIEKRQAARNHPSCEKNTGQETFDKCLLYSPQLDGHDIAEGYLPRGTFHSLANIPVLGWHPRYKEMLSTAVP